MRLAERCGAVPVEPKHLGERRNAVGALTRVSGERSGGFRDGTHVADMMISPGEECHSAGRTQCGGMEFVVFQSAFCEPFESRHLNGSAEGAGLAETHIVDQNDQDVGCARRCFDFKPRRGLGVADVEYSDRRNRWLRNWEDRPIDYRAIGRIGFHLGDNWSIRSQKKRRGQVSESDSQNSNDDARGRRSSRHNKAPQ